MKYSGIIYNDFSAAPGVCLTFFTQGCPAPHCKGCHNPETWDFNLGREFKNETLDSIIKGLTANGVRRSLAIMGGEPLCSGNLILVDYIIEKVKEVLPETKIYIWTRYLYEDLYYQMEYEAANSCLNCILRNTDFLIDGPYIEEQRDITLPMRGSKNQRIWDLKTGEIIDVK